MIHINMSVRFYSVVTVRQIDIYSLVVIFIVIRQVFEYTVFYYCIYSARCMRILRRFYIWRILNDDLNIRIIAQNTDCFVMFTASLKGKVSSVYIYESSS